MHRPLRRLQNVFAACAIASLLAISSATDVSAQKLLAPADGATVRESVKIAVDPSAVPEGGCISVYVDGFFIGASAPDDSGSKKPLVFYWNSKAMFEDPNRAPGDRVVKDGKHVVTVSVHDSSGRATETLTSNIVVANKVARLSPNDTVKLAYKYRLGTGSEYKVTVDSQSIGASGEPEGGISPIAASYRILQTAEDVRPDGSALLSYRTQADGACYVQGKGYPINGGRPSGTVYKDMDAFGRVIRDNILARRGRRSVPDVLIQLPRTPIKIGETWNSSEQFRLEGVGEIITLNMTNTLEDLEWEKNQECAKIKCTYTGSGNLVSGSGYGVPSNINGEGVFYVGLKTGKMVKSVINISANIVIEAAAASAQAGPSAPSTAVDDFSNPAAGGSAPRSSYGAAPSSGASSYGAASSGVEGGPKQVRLTITTQL